MLGNGTSLILTNIQPAKLPWLDLTVPQNDLSYMAVSFALQHLPHERPSNDWILSALALVMLAAFAQPRRQIPW